MFLHFSFIFNAVFNVYIFFFKRKIHTKRNFPINFTKVVRPVGLFMLKKNLYLFLRSINTLARNYSVKVDEGAQGGSRQTIGSYEFSFMIFGFKWQKTLLRSTYKGPLHQ